MGGVGGRRSRAVWYRLVIAGAFRSVPPCMSLRPGLPGRRRSRPHPLVAARHASRATPPGTMPSSRPSPLPTTDPVPHVLLAQVSPDEDFLT